MLNRWSIILLLMLSHYFAKAQQPYSYSFNERHGFPSNEIYYLHQDRIGNMWIGCNDGLYKYNGITFRQYTNPAQSGRSISFIREDDKGRIWCQNFTGQIFCIEHDSMSVAFDASTRLSHYPVFDVSRSGTLYVGGKNELFIYGNDKTLTTLTLPSNDGSIITALGCTPDESVIAVGSRIYKYSDRKITILDKTNDPITFSKILRRRGNFETSKGKTLFLSEITQSREYALVEIRNDSVLIRSVLPENLTQARLYNINAIDGELWLNTQNGTQCITEELRPKRNILLQGSNVSDITKDNEGNYWIATLESGIHIVPNLHIVQYTKTNSGLTHNNITSLFHDANSLYIGYFNGQVSKVNNSTFSDIPFDKTYKYTSTEKIAKSPINDALLFCHNYLSLQIGAIRTIKTTYNVRDMIFMTNGNILYANGESAGIVALNDQDSVTRLRKVSSRCVAFDPTSDRKWGGFNDGVFYFGSDNTAIELKHKNRKIFATCMKFIDSILWIGSVSEGLLGVKGTKVIYNFTEMNGLHGRNVRVLHKEGNSIWVATESGINILDVTTGKITCINKYDGLPAAEINDILVNGDTVLLATTSGIFTFPKVLQTSNKRRPDIFIDKVLVNNTPVDISHELSLSHDRNKLTVQFHTSGLGEKNSYTYHYMLEGYDASWQKVPRTANSITYSSLPPGEYKFHIKTANEDGYLSESTATFTLSINKPFWQRWWFYLLIIIASICLVSFIFLNRIRAIKNKARLEQLIRSSQLTALKAQMNPHFVFNALNSIQDLILKNDVRSSNIYLGRFSELMRKVLDASGKDIIPLQEETDILRLYLDLEKLRFGDTFIYNMDIDKGIDTTGLNIPSMIIQPFIENAIKHGLLHKQGMKQLDIRFSISGNNIQCIIIDNGVGRKASSEIKQRSKRPHTGFAIKATEKRLDLLNDYHREKIGLQITDLEENGTPTGTMITLVLPFETDIS